MKNHMLLLTRTVRFAINPGDEPGPVARGVNGFAGVPAIRGLGRHYELDVVCRGEADAATGYFINIKDIDTAVRKTAIPTIAMACNDARESQREPAAVLVRLLPPLNEALGKTVRSVRWHLSPYYSVEINVNQSGDSRPAVPGSALLRQKFEIAAAHRLHAPSLSDEDNRRVFGKCNNPSGHGHNYVIEPCVEVSLDAASNQRFFLADLERAVEETILKPFDHTHLNVDTPEFASGAGLNPSVENISRVFYERLAPAIAAKGASLRNVTVWETEKTSSTFPG